MDGVGTPIIGRPRPLPRHDTPNPAYHPHTLNYEEPLIPICDRLLLTPHLVSCFTMADSMSPSDTGEPYQRRQFVGFEANGNEHHDILEDNRASTQAKWRIIARLH